ncbi:unnamed protein product, partial [Ectocarpus sp. 12 AP-2014]
MLLARSRAPQGTGGTQISCWVWGDRCRRGGRLCAACGRPRPCRRVRPEGVRRSILAVFFLS